MYSGPTASYSYKLLEKITSQIKTIFVLGNSHFAPFKGCGLGLADELETPLGNLIVDKKIWDELLTTKLFV